MEEQTKYPKWFTEMMQDFLDMRDAQKAYFSQPNDYRLRLSKSREGKADQHLSCFIANGLLHHKDKPGTNQKELFT